MILFIALPLTEDKSEPGYRWGRSLPCFAEIVVRLRDILERFLNAVGCLDACFVADETLENLPLATKVGQTKPTMGRGAPPTISRNCWAKEWLLDRDLTPLCARTGRSASDDRACGPPRKGQ